nr:MAG TPA: hypothetical protein [Caudoviricetes sp.]
MRTKVIKPIYFYFHLIIIKLILQHFYQNRILT